MRILVFVSVLTSVSAPWAQSAPQSARVEGEKRFDWPVFRFIHPGAMSIVARDPQTGEMGVAVESHYFSVGPVCPWAEAGIGAVATQADARATVRETRPGDDLRVEDSTEPIVELKRLVRLQRAYRFAFRGDDFAKDKDWELAISSYRKAVELAPEKEELRYLLAEALFLAGRDGESLPIFREVFREHRIWVEITRRNVLSGDLPNDPARIQRILDQEQPK